MPRASAIRNGHSIEWAEGQRRHAWEEGAYMYAINGQIIRLVDIILNFRPLLAPQPQLVNLMMRANAYESERDLSGFHDFTLYNAFLEILMPILENVGWGGLPHIRFLHEGFLEFQNVDGTITREPIFRIGNPNGGEWADPGMSPEF